MQRTDGMPRQSVAEVAAEEIRRRIFDERLQAGTRLGSQEEVVAGMGVSRGSAREALRLLVNQGLIISKPGPSGGVYVTRPNSQTVVTAAANYLNFLDLTVPGIYVARLAVEPKLAELAAIDSRGNDGRLQQVVEAEARLLFDTRPFDYAACAAETVRFHLVLAQCSWENPLSLFASVLLDLSSSEGRQISALSSASSRQVRSPKVYIPNHMEHRAIADAVSSGDGELAMSRMHDHLVHAREAVAGVAVWRKRPRV